LLHFLVKKLEINKNAIQDEILHVNAMNNAKCKQESNAKTYIKIHQHHVQVHSQYSSCKFEERLLS